MISGEPITCRVADLWSSTSRCRGLCLRVAITWRFSRVRIRCSMSWVLPSPRNDSIRPRGHTWRFAGSLEPAVERGSFGGPLHARIQVEGVAEHAVPDPHRDRTSGGWSWASSVGSARGCMRLGSGRSGWGTVILGDVLGMLAARFTRVMCSADQPGASATTVPGLGGRPETGYRNLALPDSECIDPILKLSGVDQ